MNVTSLFFVSSSLFSFERGHISLLPLAILFMAQCFVFAQSAASAFLFFARLSFAVAVVVAVSLVFSQTQRNISINGCGGDGKFALQYVQLTLPCVTPCARFRNVLIALSRPPSTRSLDVKRVAIRPCCPRDTILIPFRNVVASIFAFFPPRCLLLTVLTCPSGTTNFSRTGSPAPREHASTRAPLQPRPIATRPRVFLRVLKVARFHVAYRDRHAAIQRRNAPARRS